MDLLPALLRGLWITVQLAAGGAVLALAMAFLGGLGRVSRDPVSRSLATVYVQVFRGTSALVQLFWFYFALPMLLDVRIGAMATGILVLGLNVGSYGAEVVRGALQAVPRGQHEAALSLNLTRRQRMRHVILPQALLSMIPPFGNLLIELLKATALVSLITVADLTLVARFFRDDMPAREGEIFGTTLLLYFLIALLITLGTRRLEKRLAKGRDHGGIR
jgi:polar amino acid transport system permease protein